MSAKNTASRTDAQQRHHGQPGAPSPEPRDEPGDEATAHATHAGTGDVHRRRGRREPCVNLVVEVRHRERGEPAQSEPFEEPHRQQHVQERAERRQHPQDGGRCDGGPHGVEPSEAIGRPRPRDDRERHAQHRERDGERDVARRRSQVGPQHGEQRLRRVELGEGRHTRCAEPDQDAPVLSRLAVVSRPVRLGLHVGSLRAGRLGSRRAVCRVSGPGRRRPAVRPRGVRESPRCPAGWCPCSRSRTSRWPNGRWL